MQVISGMVAHDVDQRYMRTPGVVQIGHAVGKPRSHVEQSQCRFVAHPGITIRGAADHTFKQAQYRVHALIVTNCRNQLHFRGAWI